jgi:hypothetical protein
MNCAEQFIFKSMRVMFVIVACYEVRLVYCTYTFTPNKGGHGNLFVCPQIANAQNRELIHQSQISKFRKKTLSTVLGECSKMQKAWNLPYPKQF